MTAVAPQPQAVREVQNVAKEDVELLLIVMAQMAAETMAAGRRIRENLPR